MIESVKFFNFKVLRETTLPLGRFTLIVGPNGSGKSTAIEALQVVSGPGHSRYENLVSTQCGAPHQCVQIVVSSPDGSIVTAWKPHDSPTQEYRTQGNRLQSHLHGLRVYSLEAAAIAEPVKLTPNMAMQSDGAGLAGVLDRLRDQEPERFEQLNQELGRWLPEFDRVLFDTPSEGTRALKLRTRDAQHVIPAKDLSHGTLLALAILTLAYLPQPPTILCLEEPDRGIHPRLLRDVRDALYRLSYPEQHGEKRPPVQVVATTHSPYFLDLFRDHPEEVVIAEKVGLEAKFERLSDRPDVDEILRDTQLSEAWYSGILGGVPVGQ
jgi:predicted ATPase